MENIDNCAIYSSSVINIYVILEECTLIPVYQFFVFRNNNMWINYNTNPENDLNVSIYIDITQIKLVSNLKTILFLKTLK